MVLLGKSEKVEEVHKVIVGLGLIDDTFIIGITTNQLKIE